MVVYRVVFKAGLLCLGGVQPESVSRPGPAVLERLKDCASLQPGTARELDRMSIEYNRSMAGFLPVPVKVLIRADRCPIVSFD